MRVPRNLGGGEHYGPPGTDAGALDGDLLWSFQWLSRRKQVHDPLDCPTCCSSPHSSLLIPPPSSE